MHVPVSPFLDIKGGDIHTGSLELRLILLDFDWLKREVKTHKTNMVVTFRTTTSVEKRVSLTLKMLENVWSLLFLFFVILILVQRLSNSLSWKNKEKRLNPIMTFTSRNMYPWVTLYSQLGTRRFGTEIPPCTQQLLPPKQTVTSPNIWPVSIHIKRIESIS